MYKTVKRWMQGMAGSRVLQHSPGQGKPLAYMPFDV